MGCKSKIYLGFESIFHLGPKLRELYVSMEVTIVNGILDKSLVLKVPVSRGGELHQRSQISLGLWVKDRKTHSREKHHQLVGNP